MRLSGSLTRYAIACWTSSTAFVLSPTPWAPAGAATMIESSAAIAAVIVTRICARYLLPVFAGPDAMDRGAWFMTGRWTRRETSRAS